MAIKDEYPKTREVNYRIAFDKSLKTPRKLLLLMSRNIILESIKIVRERRKNNKMEQKRFNNDRNDRAPAEMHKTTCTGCKQECEVPFKPTEGRDVFCKDCFMKNRK